MMFTTHLHVGNILYKRIEKNDAGCFKINRMLFMYGNIKPDVTKMVFVPHQHAKTEELFVRQMAIVRDESKSDKERSVALGVVSHFICDYFCKFHAKKPYNQYSKWTHYWYEWELHFTVLKDIFGKIFSDDEFIKNPLEHRDVEIYIRDNLDSIKKMKKDENQELVDLLNSYYGKAEKTEIDKDFAFYAINTIFSKLLGSEIFQVKNGVSQSIVGDYDSTEDGEFLQGKYIG